MKTLIPVFILMAVLAKDEDKKLMMSEALEKNFITAKVSGLGGHSGYCVEISATNTSNTDTTFWIEAGRRLESEDTTIQDILIVKELPLFVRAGETKTVPVYGFCCQATNGGPKVGELFRPGKMADKQLTAIAQFLNQHNYDESVCQSAVWIVSNGHSLASITADSPEKRKEIKPLQAFLAKLMGLSEKHSWYSLSYTPDTTRLFSGHADSLWGDYEFEMWKNGMVRLIINDEKNNVVRRLIVDKPYNPGKYTQEIKLKVTDWPKGRYFVRLYMDNQRKVEREFEL